MIRRIVILLILNLTGWSARAQFIEAETFTNKNWINSAALEADTIWVGSSGGVLKWLKDGTLLESYTNIDGLMHTWTTAVAVDLKGNQWFGSQQGGITRFDGTAWTHFDELMQDFDSEITAIMPDEQGRIWFASYEGGVCSWDGSSMTMHPPGENGPMNSVANSMATDSAGRVWFGNAAGVSSYDHGEWTYYYLLDGTMTDAQLIMAMAMDRGNTGWFAHFQGISSFDGTTWTHYDKSGMPFPGNDGIRSLSVEGDSLWVGTYDNGIFIYDISDAVWSQLDPLVSGLTGGRIQEIDVLGDGTKLISTGDLVREGGVTMFEGGNWSQFTTEAPFGHNFITGLAEDAEGNMWFGTFGAGVSVYDGSEWTTYRQAGSPLLSDRVNSIVGEPGGGIWIASASGLSHVKDGNWINYDGGSGIPSGGVNDLEPDGDGGLWAAHGSGGLLLFDGQNWTSYSTENSGIVSNNLFQVALDGQGRIWAGSVDGGISVFDGDTWTTHNSSTGAFTGNYVSGLECDSSGAVWAAVDGKVYRYDGSIWESYDGTGSELDGTWVNFIHCDHKGFIWFGTGDERHGAIVTNGSSWFSYGVHNSPLVHNTIFSMGSDREGNLWVGTSGGLSRLRYDYTTSVGPPQDKPHPSLMLYPNPVTDQLQVDAGDVTGPVLLQVFDLNGRMRLEKQFGSLPATLNAGELERGMYLLRINGKNGNESRTSRFFRK